MGPNTEANNGFWTSVGATFVRFELYSRRCSADADAELMNRWVEARLDRASNYKLVHWRGPTPRQWLATMATLLTALTAAPTGAQATEKIPACQALLQAPPVRGST